MKAAPIEKSILPFSEHVGSDEAIFQFVRTYFRFQLNQNVLDIGPTKNQMNRYSDLVHPARYTAIDNSYFYRNTRARFLKMDATKMFFSEGFFDFIFCNEVLPFIRSDYQAMSEIHRCLKKTGVAMLNSHRMGRKTERYGESRLRKDEPRKKRLEWVYGDDYFERLEAAGFFIYPFLFQNTEIVLGFKYKSVLESFLEQFR